MARRWTPWLRWCSTSLMLVGMNIFCLVRRLISSLSIPPLPSEDFKDSAMLSAVSDRTLLVSDGDRNRLKFDGVAIWSQNKTP